ncbi:MAG: hypothetical protein ACRYHQ_00360 [Janthinobacterium lividum]
MPDRGRTEQGDVTRGHRILRAARAGTAWLGWGLAAGLAARMWTRRQVAADGPAAGQPVPGQPNAEPTHAAGKEEQEHLPPAQHERTDVGLRAMAIAGVLMMVGLGGMLALASWLYPGSRTDKTLTPPNGSEFPAPRLQTDVGADMARFRAEQMQQLNGAYWLDRDRDVVHMPIRDAMQDVASHGIPDWPASPAWVRR